MTRRFQIGGIWQNDDGSVLCEWTFDKEAGLLTVKCGGETRQIDLWPYSMPLRRRLKQIALENAREM